MVAQVRAYHFGARFIVEMEVVMPADMTVRESHDIALQLQHKARCTAQHSTAHPHTLYHTLNLKQLFIWSTK